MEVLNENLIIVLDTNLQAYQVAKTLEPQVRFEFGPIYYRNRNENYYQYLLFPQTDIGQMVNIPSGCFDMGSEKYGLDDEAPVHYVCVKSFDIDKYEVTQGVFRRVMGYNNSDNQYCGDDCPVENVTWNEARDFCKTIGKRLPTEAEWEYAARAGTITDWYCGDSYLCTMKMAWFGDAIQKVGQLMPNNWGLHDMGGNVWEWVADNYTADYYSKSLQDNPQGPPFELYKVIRGGSYDYEASHTRSANRYFQYPSVGSENIGFRCAM